MSSSSGQARGNLFVFGTAFLLLTLPSLYLLIRDGFSDATFGEVLRTGARVAIPVFLTAFVARPLHEVFPSDGTRWLLRVRRQLMTSQWRKMLP